jgi:hypothetical protein
VATSASSTSRPACSPGPNDASPPFSTSTSPACKSSAHHTFTPAPP